MRNDGKLYIYIYICFVVVVVTLGSPFEQSFIIPPQFFVQQLNISFVVSDVRDYDLGHTGVSNFYNYCSLGVAVEEKISVF